jgi:glycerol uptake facilitator-like aquaporin
MTAARRLTAEALGTALLVTAVVGSGIMADRLTEDTALALLANTIATGAALIALITIFAPISGAHFNPAVTLVMALRRDLPVALAAAYIAVQCAGGLLGTWAAHAMFDLPILQLSTTIRTGPAQWLAEAVATFGLIMAILGAISARANVAFIVAAYITAAYWFTASTSFANPAVALARSLTDTFAGIRPADLPGFMLAEIAGALIAMLLGNWLFRPPSAPVGHQNRPGTDQTNAQPIRRRQVFLQEHHRKHRDQNHTQLVNRRHTRGIAQLQGSVITQPRRASCDARQRQKHIGPPRHRPQRLPLPGSNHDPGNHKQNHHGPDQRRKIRPDIRHPDLAKNRRHRGETCGQHRPKLPTCCK